MHVYYSRTLVSYRFIKKEKLFKPRISLLIALVSIKFNNIYETGVLYNVIKISYNNRQVLAISRFKDTFEDKSFVSSIQLKGIRALYDMIRCLKRPEHLVVRVKIKKWLAYSDTQANKVMYLA
jgi:hypothetical protein